MIRWMESLVQRSGAESFLPTIQMPWRIAADDTASRTQQFNRLLNAGIALVALILLFPVLLIIGVLVWISSPGPILYTQVRVGLDRRLPADAAQNHRR